MSWNISTILHQIHICFYILSISYTIIYTVSEVLWKEPRDVQMFAKRLNHSSLRIVAFQQCMYIMYILLIFNSCPLYTSTKTVKLKTYSKPPMAANSRQQAISEVHFLTYQKLVLYIHCAKHTSSACFFSMFCLDYLQNDVFFRFL